MGHALKQSGSGAVVVKDAPYAI